MVVMQVYVNSIDPIEFSFLGYKVHIGVFTIGLLFCLKWLIKLIINSVCAFFIKVFLNNKSLGDQKSINNISKLILTPHEDFSNTIRKTSISEKYKNITTSLIIKNNVKTNYSLNKTGEKEIDIHLLNNELTELLELNKYSEALQLVNNILKQYKHEISVIKYKILVIAKYAKKNNIKFKFNPRKSKYKLDKEFINDYEIELAMVDFQTINDNNSKLKIVENLYKKFPLHEKTGLYLLKFLIEYKPIKYDDNKIINLIHSIFISNPNRNIAYLLVKLYNKNNIFEVSQEILQDIPNNNIEKIWFLLIIATNMKLFHIIKELIKNIININSNETIEHNMSNSYNSKNNNIIQHNNIDQLNKFFIKNYSVLSVDNDIVKLIISKN